MPLFPMRMGGVDPGKGGFWYAAMAALVFAVGAVAFWLLVDLVT